MRLQRILCAATFLIGFALCSELRAATTWKETISYQASPDRFVEDSMGSLEVTSLYLVRVSGFPWSLPHWLRLAAGNPPLRLYIRTETDDRAWGGTFTPRFPLPPSSVGPPQQEIRLPFYSPEFVFFGAGRAQWGEFTYPGERWTTSSAADWVAEAELLYGSITLNIPQVGSVSIEPSDLHISAVPPSSSRRHLGEKTWMVRCKDPTKEWDDFEEKCVCRPDQPCGEGCPDPDRMIKDEEGRCWCDPQYLPVGIGGYHVACRTPEEAAMETLRARGFENLGQNFQRLDGPNITGILTVCGGRTTYEYMQDGRLLTGYETSCIIYYCFSDGTCQRVRNLNGFAAGQEPRWACFNSFEDVTYRPCNWDPYPHQPLELGFIDLASMIPECRGPERPEWCSRVNPGTPGQGFPPAEGADLAVGFLRILPAEPMVNDPLEFEIHVTNGGTEQAPPTELEFQLDRPALSPFTLRRFVGALAAGQSRVLTVRSAELGGYRARLGDHQVVVRIDPDLLMDEEFRENNVLETSFSADPAPAATGPDLRVEGVEPRAANPASGHPLELDVTVRNVGTAAAPPSQCGILVGTDAGSPPMGGTVDLPALAAGQAATVFFTTGSPLDPGHYGVAAHADSTHLVAEQNEGNNLLIHDVIVFDSSLECLPCTSGEPTNQVGALFCQGGDGGPYPGLMHICRGVRADGTTCANDPNNPNGWEHVGAQCPDPASLAPGWHPNACGVPDVCPGSGP